VAASVGGLVIAAYAKIADPVDWERHESNISAAPTGVLKGCAFVVANRATRALP
jgi:hypothetical protein